MIQHLLQVALLVREYDEALAYYCGVLGFVLIEDIAMSSTKRWVVISPAPEAQTRILLARAEGVESSAVGNQFGGRVGLFLKVPDARRRYDELVAAGVHFEERPRTEPYGTVAVFRDPYGNRWDLLSDP